MYVSSFRELFLKSTMRASSLDTASFLMFTFSDFFAVKEAIIQISGLVEIQDDLGRNGGTFRAELSAVRINQNSKFVQEIQNVLSSIFKCEAD